MNFNQPFTFQIQELLESEMEDPLLNSLVAGYLAQVTPKLAASFKKTVKVNLQFSFVKVLK